MTIAKRISFSYLARRMLNLDSYCQQCHTTQFTTSFVRLLVWLVMCIAMKSAIRIFLWKMFKSWTTENLLSLILGYVCERLASIPRSLEYQTRNNTPAHYASRLKALAACWNGRLLKFIKNIFSDDERKTDVWTGKKVLCCRSKCRSKCRTFLTKNSVNFGRLKNTFFFFIAWIGPAEGWRGCWAKIAIIDWRFLNRKSLVVRKLRKIKKIESAKST